MKNKVIDYVMQSPQNTNRAVLESILEAIIGDGSGGGTSGGGAWYLGEKTKDDELINGAFYKLTDHHLTADELDGGLLVVEFANNLGTHFFPLSVEDGSVVDDDGVLFIDIGIVIAISFGDEYGAEMGLSDGTYLIVLDVENANEKVINNCALIWK